MTTPTKAPRQGIAVIALSASVLRLALEASRKEPRAHAARAPYLQKFLGADHED